MASRLHSSELELILEGLTMSSRNMRALGGGDLLGFLSSLPRLQLRPSPYSLSRAVWPWPAGEHPATEVLCRCSRTGTNDLPHGAFQHAVWISLTSLYSLFLLFAPSPWLVVAIKGVSLHRQVRRSGSNGGFRRAEKHARQVVVHFVAISLQ